jgi:hypothetical protein
MPPSARALTPEISTMQPEMPAALVTRQFIEDSVDRIVRSEVGKKELSKEKLKKNPLIASTIPGFLL